MSYRQPRYSSKGLDRERQEKGGPLKAKWIWHLDEYTRAILRSLRDGVYREITIEVLVKHGSTRLSIYHETIYHKKVIVGDCNLERSVLAIKNSVVDAHRCALDPGGPSGPILVLFNRLDNDGFVSPVGLEIEEDEIHDFRGPAATLAWEERASKDPTSEDPVGETSGEDKTKTKPQVETVDPEKTARSTLRDEPNKKEGGTMDHKEMDKLGEWGSELFSTGVEGGKDASALGASATLTAAAVAVASVEFPMLLLAYERSALAQKLMQVGTPVVLGGVATLGWFGQTHKAPIQQFCLRAFRAAVTVNIYPMFERLRAPLMSALQKAMEQERLSEQFHNR